MDREAHKTDLICASLPYLAQKVVKLEIQMRNEQFSGWGDNSKSLACKPENLGSIPAPATFFFFFFKGWCSGRCFTKLISVPPVLWRDLVSKEQGRWFPRSGIFLKTPGLHIYVLKCTHLEACVHNPPHIHISNPEVWHSPVAFQTVARWGARRWEGLIPPMQLKRHTPSLQMST